MREGKKQLLLSFDLHIHNMVITHAYNQTQKLNQSTWEMLLLLYPWSHQSKTTSSAQQSSMYWGQYLNRVQSTAKMFIICAVYFWGHGWRWVSSVQQCCVAEYYKLCWDASTREFTLQALKKTQNPKCFKNFQARHWWSTPLISAYGRQK